MLQRLFNFLSGTKISSSQVNQEFDQLISYANTNEDDKTSIRNTAQMVKITNDAGGVKLSLQNATDDLLASVANASQGPLTFYAAAAVLNTPTSNSIRGFAHITSTGFGYIMGLDSAGVLYTNTLTNGAWSGWNPQASLWSGQFYPSASQTITPSKKLSQCKNGWVLVWSDYDAGVGTNDVDISFTYIPKSDPFLGKAHLFTVANYLSSTTLSVIVKRITVNDATLVGHDDNNVSATSTNDVCLRNVLEY